MLHMPDSQPRPSQGHHIPSQWMHVGLIDLFGVSGLSVCVCASVGRWRMRNWGKDMGMLFDICSRADSAKIESARWDSL